MKPSISKLKEFTREIGLPPIPDPTKYLGWGNYLHEIAHWAIKPDGYIQRDLNTRYFKYYPNPNPNGSTVVPSGYYLDPYRHYDPTGVDSEILACEWGLQVLEYFKWPNPKYSDPNFPIGSLKFTRPQSTYENHFLSQEMNTYQWFEWLGIDISMGKFRTTITDVYVQEGSMIVIRGSQVYRRLIEQ